MTPQHALLDMSRNQKMEPLKSLEEASLLALWRDAFTELAAEEEHLFQARNTLTEL